MTFHRNRHLLTHAALASVLAMGATLFAAATPAPAASATAASKQVKISVAEDSASYSQAADTGGSVKPGSRKQEEDQTEQKPALDDQTDPENEPSDEQSSEDSGEVDPGDENANEDVESDEAATPSIMKLDAKPADCVVPRATLTYQPSANTETRLSGNNRYETTLAIAAAVTSIPVKANERAVFIASGADFPDGLALGALAANYGWPLLLTAPHRTDAKVLAKVAEVRPTHIFIAGGTGAVSQEVEAALTAVAEPNAKVTRFSGSNRYETAALVSECFPEGAPAYVATGENFADALVAAPVAATTGGAIVLSPSNAPNQYTLAAIAKLKPQEGHILGGTWSNNAISALKNASGTGAAFSVTKGVNRYATSAAVATKFFGSAPATQIYATGVDFPDALSGVAAAKGANAPILLTKLACRPKEIQPLTANAKTRVILGGTGVLTSSSHSGECVPPKPKFAPQKALDEARKLQGVRYLWAGNSPATGFDCSGMTQYAYNNAGKQIGRTTWQQWANGTPTTIPKPGDLVITYGGEHIGVYAGHKNGRHTQVHASSTEGKVVETPVWGTIAGFVTFE